ncbi:nuclear transport factor 2 family protein [Sphingobacterium faecium]|uniref:DUF4440 domain-containing protein n=1 Tax=Sphingobacterium faecium TaxID=34087 RepID=UPI000389F38B
MIKAMVAAVFFFMLLACQNETNQRNDYAHISKLENSTVMNKQTIKAEIEDALTIYFEALNKSNVKQAVSQYTADGVFMPTGLPTAIGTQQLKLAYENVFKAIQLNVSFKVEEIVALDDHMAFVRTQSNGTQLIRANGKKSQELNREFFLMKKENGEWMISRYMFNQPK